MPAGEKAAYRSKQAEAKAEYAATLATWEARFGPKPKRKPPREKPPPKAPPRVPTGYQLFCRAQKSAADLPTIIGGPLSRANQESFAARRAARLLPRRAPKECRFLGARRGCYLLGKRRASARVERCSFLGARRAYPSPKRRYTREVARRWRDADAATKQKFNDESAALKAARAAENGQERR